MFLTIMFKGIDDKRQASRILNHQDDGQTGVKVIRCYWVKHAGKMRIMLFFTASVLEVLPKRKIICKKYVCMYVCTYVCMYEEEELLI